MVFWVKLSENNEIVFGGIETVNNLQVWYQVSLNIYVNVSVCHRFSGPRQVETLSKTIVDLELERNRLIDELQDTQKMKKALDDQLRNMEHDLATQSKQWEISNY